MSMRWHLIDTDLMLIFATIRLVLGVNDIHIDLIKSMSFTTGATGGEYTHRLTQAEMPSHIHDIHSKWDGSKETGILNWAVPMVATTVYSDGGWLQDGLLIGGNQHHNNTQPYVVVCFWKRIK